MKMKNYKDVDEYIANFPPAVQEKLRGVRQAIKEVLPDAIEKIAYGIPTYWQGRNIVHFGGAEKHIGFYPGSTGVVAFQDELQDYETSKGTIRFPLGKPIPFDLIKKITLYCASK